MAALISNQNRPFGRMPSWDLVPAEHTPAIGATLRLANRAVPVAEIRGYLMRDGSGRDVKPALFVLAVFVGLGLAFIIAVLGLNWQFRMMAAAIVFLAIGLSALHDVVWLTRVRVYRVEVLTGRGETLVYTTTDAADAERLAETLSGVVSGKPRRD